MSAPRFRWLATIGPGMLVAATGVGAGDLATAAFAGGRLGTAVLWAVLVGAFLKFVLNEGLARWQLATGSTLLEGAVAKFGGVAACVFLPYLLVWSFFTGSALMSACGATFHAVLPIFDDASRAKVVFGVLHSLLGVVLVLLGGFRLFERVMGVCIAVMFVTVVVMACFLLPPAGELLRGLFVPATSTLTGDDLTWTVALMGGVGGTLTVLCYGYWIREKGRRSATDIRVCRVDLGVGYAMTAVFGLSMVIIGGSVVVDGRGATLVVDLADRLEGRLGPVGRWAFLIGAWGAVFSSLLGVWQAVPYLFADFLEQVRRRMVEPAGAERTVAVDTGSRSYRGFLFALATIPAAGLLFSFKEVQKAYAIFGASFMPLLVVVLLILNNRAAWIGSRHRNRWSTNVVLSVTLLFFGWILWEKT